MKYVHIYVFFWFFFGDNTAEAHDEANLFRKGGVRGSVDLLLVLCFHRAGFVWKDRNSS